MTAVELLSGLWDGVKLVCQLTFLKWWQKLYIIFLKAVAIVGYNIGKSGKQGEPVVSKQRDDWGDIRTPSGYPFHRRSGRWRKAIVVPVYITAAKDMELLLQMLCGLVKQTRQVDLLIVVDDASPICLPSFCINRINPVTQCMVMRLQQNCGPAAARNTGVKLAHIHGADVVCFLDADCLPHPAWLDRMERSQAQRPGIVCGRTLSSQGTSFVGMFHDIFGTLNGRKLQDGSLLYGCTCNLSIHLPSVHMLFDLNFADAAFEDVEFCVRARKRGVALYLDRDAVVWHHYDISIKGLYNQFHRYGRNEGLMEQLHKEYLKWLWSSDDIPSIPLHGEDSDPVPKPPVIGPIRAPLI
eukprot:jgi/Botrbrau1/17984/Bobra.0457s0003.1